MIGTNDGKTRFPATETAVLAIGEALLAAVVCLVYFLLGKFSFPVLLGALLGALLAVGNFLLLTLSVNRAVDRILSERGEGAMSEEESADFAAAHQGQVAAAVRFSFLLRMLGLAAILIAGFLSGWFDALATLITLLPWRAFLSLGGILGKKTAQNGKNADRIRKEDQNE